jgi:hypothetical protein
MSGLCCQNTSILEGCIGGLVPISWENWMPQVVELNHRPVVGLMFAGIYVHIARISSKAKPNSLEKDQGQRFGGYGEAVGLCLQSRGVEQEQPLQIHIHSPRTRAHSRVYLAR